MRSGRLKTRTYKIHRGVSPAAVLLFLLGAALGALGLWQAMESRPPLALPPAPTLTPEEGARDERTLTLPGCTWYALQLGAFNQEDAAQACAQRYIARGAAGYIHHQDSWRVLAAAYPARGDAQAVQTQLRTAHSVDSFLTEISRPEITLRLTGQRAQLTVIQDAFDLMDQSIQQLSDLSQRLDQGKAAAPEARALLFSLQSTLDALARKMDERFPASSHGAVRQLRALLGDASAQLYAAQSAKGATQLGALVKRCQLLCLCRMAEYARTLAA